MGLTMILAVLTLPWKIAGLFYVRVIVAICLGYLNPWDWVVGTVELVAVILWMAMLIAAFSWALWGIWRKPIALALMKARAETAAIQRCCAGSTLIS